MYKRISTLGILLMPLLFADPVRSDTAYLLDETDFLMDIPEVTSATRLPQKLSEAPASLTIIDRAMIDASGLQTIPDLLRLVPGFQSFMVTQNMYGTTYHGVSDEYPNRLEVMIDGRSVYVPLLSTVVWESLGLHLDDIDRIEVVRGSNVPSQGSNAFFGSINIITYQPLASKGLTVSTLAGSSQTRNAHVRWADSNEGFGYWVSAGHEQNDGNRHFSEFYTGDWFAADGSDGDWRDDLSRNYLNLSTSWTPDLFTNIQLQAGIDRGTKTTGVLDVTDGHFSERDHESSYGQLKYNYLYSDTGSLQLTAYRNRLRMDTPRASVADLLTELGLPANFDLSTSILPILQQDIPAGDPLAGFIQTIIDSNGYHLKEEEGATRSTDAELQLSDRIGDLRFVTGIGYRYMDAQSEIMLQDGAVDEERSRAFTSLIYEFDPQWQLNSGFMYEYSSESTEAFSYRNALIFKPQDSSSLRLGYSSSERIPSLLERYRTASLYLPAYPPYLDESWLYDYSTAANPDLNEEKISSWELGFYQAFPRQRGYADVRVFREQVDDAIIKYWSSYDGELNPNDQRVPVNRNIGHWVNDGIEFQLKVQPNDDLWVLLNYAYINTRRDNIVTGDPGTGKEYQLSLKDPLSPEHTASLLLNWSPVNDLDLSVAHYFMDNVVWFEGGYRDAYNRTDLRAAKRWQPDSHTELETALIVQNAFGPSYAEFYQYNTFDRRTYLQLKLNFR